MHPSMTIVNFIVTYSYSKTWILATTFIFTCLGKFKIPITVKRLDYISGMVMRKWAPIQQTSHLTGQSRRVLLQVLISAKDTELCKLITIIKIVRNTLKCDVVVPEWLERISFPDAANDSSLVRECASRVKSISKDVLYKMHFRGTNFFFHVGIFSCWYKVFW